MDEKLSEKAEDAVEISLSEILELDVCEQNRVVERICTGILKRRKETLELMLKNKEQYVEWTDEFVKILQSIN